MELTGNLRTFCFKGDESCAIIAESCARQAPEPGDLVSFMINNKVVGTWKVAESQNMYRVILHGTRLAELQKNGQKLVFVTSCVFNNDSRLVSFPYMVTGLDDPPSTLGDVDRNGYYPWDLFSMSAVEFVLD